jgi:ABC-type cobalamin/Fe3+-siderophores transport system ATPase subunit
MNIGHYFQYLEDTSTRRYLFWYTALTVLNVIIHESLFLLMYYSWYAPVLMIIAILFFFLEPMLSQYKEEILPDIRWHQMREINDICQRKSVESIMELPSDFIYHTVKGSIERAETTLLLIEEIIHLSLSFIILIGHVMLHRSYFIIIFAITVYLLRFNMRLIANKWHQKSVAFPLYYLYQYFLLHNRIPYLEKSIEKQTLENQQSDATYASCMYLNIAQVAFISFIFQSWIGNDVIYLSMYLKSSNYLFTMLKKAVNLSLLIERGGDNLVTLKNLPPKQNVDTFLLSDQWKFRIDTLDNIRLDSPLIARSGELIILRGDSGSGKSTLLSLIKGIRSSGEVTINGRKTSYRSLSDHIIYIKEELFQYIETDLVEFITDGEICDWDWLNQLLQICDLEERLSNVEKVVSTQLSHGEKARLILVKTLYQLKSRFRIALLDEMDNGIQIDLFLRILDFIRTSPVLQNKTIIAISHQPSVHEYEHLSRLWTIKQGNLFSVMNTKSRKAGQ